MFKKCDIILYPTNGEARIIYHMYQLTSVRKEISIYKTSYSDESKLFHLHILSEEEIYENDFIWRVKTGVIKNIYGKTGSLVGSSSYMKEIGYKKIIASTNKLFNLPQIPEYFINRYIEKYNKGNPIQGVMVEYDEEIHNNPTGKWDTVKVDTSTNTIVVKEIKENWNREEVIDFLKKREKNIHNYYKGPTEDFFPILDSLDEWIEKNLF